jgi:hypothetical protein
VVSRILEYTAERRSIGIAESSLVAACLDIILRAIESFASACSRVLLVNHRVSWAFEATADACRSAADVLVGICAVGVCTEQVSSIVLMNKIVGALIH